MFFQDIYDVKKALLVAGRCLCRFGVVLVWRNREAGSFFFEFSLD